MFRTTFNFGVLLAMFCILACSARETDVNVSTRLHRATRVHRRMLFDAKLTLNDILGEDANIDSICESIASDNYYDSADSQEPSAQECYFARKSLENS